MAERRMFAKTITNSDAFLEMPSSSQALYFHLSMNADDDGFINKPKALMRMVGAKEDDLKILFAKSFIIPFESGVVVIKHWKINNYIRNDRYKPTEYAEEKSLLSEKENGAYTLGIPNGYQMDTQVRLGKDSIGKDIEKKNKDISLLEEEGSSSDSKPTENDISSDKKRKSVRHKYGEFGRVLLTSDEFDRLCQDYGKDYIKAVIKALDEYVESNNNKNKYTNFNLVMRKAIREHWKLLDGLEVAKMETISNVNVTKSDDEDLDLDTLFGDVELKGE